MYSEYCLCSLSRAFPLAFVSVVRLCFEMPSAVVHQHHEEPEDHWFLVMMVNM